MNNDFMFSTLDGLEIQLIEDIKTILDNTKRNDLAPFEISIIDNIPRYIEEIKTIRKTRTRLLKFIPMEKQKLNENKKKHDDHKKDCLNWN